MAAGNGERVNFRLDGELKEDVRVVCRLRRTTISGLIKLLLAEAVRKDKERDPKLFESTRKRILSEDSVVTALPPNGSTSGPETHPPDTKTGNRPRTIKVPAIDSYDSTKKDNRRQGKR
jgi:hypothetical protein